MQNQSPLTSHSARHYGVRDVLEDFAIDQIVETSGGLRLHVAIICDGSGGIGSGELAARLTARTTIDYLTVSDQTHVPTLLIEAVEASNQKVYGELRGDGTSTISLAAVDLDDPGGPLGRLYIASVGNSIIFLIRNRQLVRLNISHTLANEYLYSGQMTRQEAAQVRNAEYPTRIIGAAADIQVDIGFYAERGRDFVNSQRAFNIGKRGMLLREGDTIVILSNGMFHGGERNPNDSVLHTQDLLAHAQDAEVDHTVETLMQEIVRKRPLDNVSMAMIFVPSEERLSVMEREQRKQRRSRRALVAAPILLLLLLAISYLFFLTEIERRDLQLTQTAIAPLINVQDANADDDAEPPVAMTDDVTPAPTQPPPMTGTPPAPTQPGNG